jgi:hypothetical protein
VCDNCPAVANATQADTDNDELGDACDVDLDGDAVDNGLDNCPFDENPTQGDSDAYSASITATPFNLRSLSPNAQVAVSGDDQVSARLPIGFGFEWFGTVYSEVYVGTNGFVSFERGQGNYVNSSTLPTGPTTAAPPAAILGYWTDLDADEGLIVYETLGAAPNRTFVVSWENVPHYGGVTAERPLVSFQVVLREADNVAEVQCLDCPTDNGRAVQGVTGPNDVYGLANPARNNVAFSLSADGVALLTAADEGDGVGDACDVCPLVLDPNQRDTDGDGVGDACEAP